MSETINLLGVRDLRLAVAERLDGISASQAKLITDAVLDAIAEALGQGCALTLPPLGSFRPVYRGPRHGTGPDGKPYSSPAKVVLKYRPSRALAERLAAVESGAA